MKECPTCELCFDDDVNFCPHDQAQTRLSLPGGQLLASRYFLERRLGRGAMGHVYLARDANLGTRKVAVKTVRPDLLDSGDLQEGEAVARFEREARAAASISHPHVVDVTDFGKTADGVFFLVMEYVEGENLHRLLRREGTLSVRRAVNLLRQICEGVEAAHDLGIIHRDLKPANIFILKKRNEEDDGFVKVGDFGLAKIISATATDASGATPSSRGIIGTPEYMSPEQMQPELGVDTRSDIYSLGTIAYLMLGGRTPFVGDMMQLVMQKVMQVPPPLSSLRTEIPGSVELAIMSALERQPDRRPPNVSAWLKTLRIAADSVTESGTTQSSRLVILAPPGSEVYVDDERRGSIGTSTRLVLSGIPAGQHVLRVSREGDRDDERVIEIRAGGEEQVIQTQLRPTQHSSHGSQPSGSGGSTEASMMPGIVSCVRCGSRFAEGVKFCGRCGGNSFAAVANPHSPETFPCPQCSASLPEFSRFCGRCGYRLSIGTQTEAVKHPTFGTANPPSSARMVERICRRCGATFQANVRFCGRCGNDLSV